MSCRKLAISLAADIISHPVSHRDGIYCSPLYGGPVLPQKDKLSRSPHWSFVLHKRTGLLVPVSRLETESWCPGAYYITLSVGDDLWVTLTSLQLLSLWNPPPTCTQHLQNEGFCTLIQEWLKRLFHLVFFPWLHTNKHTWKPYCKLISLSKQQIWGGYDFCIVHVLYKNKRNDLLHPIVI